MSVSYMCDFGWCDVYCVADMWRHVRISLCLCVSYVCVCVVGVAVGLAGGRGRCALVGLALVLVHGYAYAWPAMVLAGSKFVCLRLYWRLMGCWCAWWPHVHDVRVCVCHVCHVLMGSVG